jgi:ketosteroid isomerase-like protein
MISMTDLGTNESEPVSDDPSSVIAAVYECFGRGDIAALFNYIDPDVDWGSGFTSPGADLVPMFARGHGIPAVEHYFGGVAQLEFHRFEPVRFLVDGEIVVTELALEVSHRSTGKRVAFEEIHHFKVRDGRIVRYKNFLDTAALIELFRP